MSKSPQPPSLLSFKPGAGDLGEHRKKSPRIQAEKGKNSLTEKQAIVYNFIRKYQNEVGFPPTVREIAHYFGITGKAAHDHIKAISKKGYLRVFPGSARGMELLHKDEIKDNLNDELSELSNEETVTIPLLGHIAAGTPILAEENIESNIALPTSFVPKGGDLFALRVRGDSMENAGILDNDIAVMKQIRDVNIEVKNGDIVAALIDGDVTLKTFFQKQDRIELRPENPNYKPILLTATMKASIMAKLVGIYRKYNA